MPRSLADLQDTLFSQLDRLSNTEMSEDDLKNEISRSEAMRDLADQITGIANTQLKAAKLFVDHGQAVLPHLPQIGRATPKDSDK